MAGRIAPEALEANGTIFDRYIAVDWSANNGPKTGKDSIWIGEATPAGPLPSRNPSTRSAAIRIPSTLITAPAAPPPAAPVASVGTGSAPPPEPLAADATPAGDGRRNAMLRIAAGLLRIGRHRLLGEIHQVHGNYSRPMKFVTSLASASGCSMSTQWPQALTISSLALGSAST